MSRLLVWIILACAALCGQAQAHDLRPALLTITESSPGTYSVHWKAPAMGELRLAVYPRLPKSAVELAPHEAAILDDAYIDRWSVSAPSGFVGETIAMDGLTETRADVLVRIEWLSGETSTARLTAANPSFEVPAVMGWQQVASAYLFLGVEHILFGVDHLIFVLALILLVRGWRQIGLTVTAFTLAHSITLGAATLGYLNVPGPPVEAAIALSIALVAVEIVNSCRGRESLTARLPWLIAFAFGLLHGLGFAGALSEVGLPTHAIPIALLFFNVGVELGQLAFIAGVLIAFSLLRQMVIAAVIREPDWRHAWPRLIAAYGIGGIASFWLVERVSGFWV